MDLALQQQWTHPLRDAPRRLGTAEGVLVALLGCSLEEAFLDIVQTAKQHNVAPLRLADALVALAQDDREVDVAHETVELAQRVWGDLLSTTRLAVSARPAAG